MGMCLGLVSISDENIDRILSDPPLVWKFVAPDAPEYYLEARGIRKQTGLLSWLLGRSTAIPTDPVDLVIVDNECVASDLDKAWHGIYYLLTGKAEGGDSPLNFLQEGGTEIPDIDVGYGNARAYRAAETREILDALRRIGEEELVDRYNPKDMLAQGIYPNIWLRDSKEETLDYLIESIGILRGFLAQAVDAGLGILVYLT